MLSDAIAASQWKRVGTTVQTACSSPECQCMRRAEQVLTLTLCPDVPTSMYYFADVRETVSLVRSVAQHFWLHQTIRRLNCLTHQAPSIKSEKPHTFYVAIIVDGTLKLALPSRNRLGWQVRLESFVYFSGNLPPCRSATEARRLCSRVTRV